MNAAITIRPEGVGDIRHSLGGSPDDPIPMLHIGPVDVVFYDFEIEPGLMSAWLADLSTHALELAAEIDAQWPVADCPECPDAEPGMGCAACGKPEVSA